MQENERDFSFKQLFVPLTTLKAIHWIVIIGLMVYANMLFNGFVWDDKTYIINNPEQHSINVLNAFRGNLFNNAGQYRPIPVLYFSVLYAIFGTSPFFYHVIQLFLHIIITILLFFLFKQFFPKTVSLFLTLIFLIHPMQVESVSYIASSVNQLFLLSGLIAILLSLRGNINYKHISAIFILLFFSLLSKETGILFLVLLLVYSFLFNRHNAKKLLAGAWITLALYAFFRFFIGSIGLETRPIAPVVSLTLPERILNVPMIIFYYLKTFFFPVVLSIDQQLFWLIQQGPTGSLLDTRKGTQVI